MFKKMIVTGSTVALFFLTLAASFAQTPPAKTGPKARGERPADFLSLTPEQQTRFDGIRKARQAEAQSFREEMGKLRPQLRAAMKDPQADPKKIDSLIDQLSQARAAHLKSVLHSLKDMEKVLTPDQLEKLRNARSGLGWRRGHGRGFGRGFGLRRRLRPGRGARPFWGEGNNFDGWL